MFVHQITKSNMLCQFLKLNQTIVSRNYLNTLNYSRLNGRFTQSQIKFRQLATESQPQKPQVKSNVTTQKITTKKSSFSKYILVFVGGVVAYFGISFYINYNDDKPSTSEKALKWKPENVKNVSRSTNRGVPNPGNIKITLYQYVTCPFCCKVRAYLDYYGYAYDIVEVNSLSGEQIAWSSYKQVPILAIQEPKPSSSPSNPIEYSKDFIQLNDSSVIISALETFRLCPKYSLKDIVSFYEPTRYVNDKGKEMYDFPNKYFVMLLKDEASDTKKINNIKDEREWRVWADDKFLHTVAPNVYRTIRETLNAFDWYDQYGHWDRNFNLFERYSIKYFGSAVMYILGKMLKRKYELKDDVRQSLYDFSKEWKDAVGNTNKFRGGATPNLADLAVYGIINSFKGTQAFQDLMKNSPIKDWYIACREQVKANKGKEKLNIKPRKENKESAPEQFKEVKKKRFYFF